MLSESTVVHVAYRILEKVAQGEVGEIYKAERRAGGGVCALKVLNPEWRADTRLVEHFKQEAERARALRHPNAVLVEDVDEAEDGRPFVVMEYVAGETLRQVMAREGHLGVERACSVARQVAAVLEVAHAQDIVHQDITPGHIMLVETPEGEQAKLLGCCIARIKEGRRRDMGRLALKHTGGLMGTPEYFSPELAAGRRNGELDGRSDLYSLGVVLYQMLSGERPFEGQHTPMDVVLAHLLAPPRPLSGVPDELASLVMRLLEKKPDLRPAGARPVVEELERVERLLRGVSAPSVTVPLGVSRTIHDGVRLEASPTGPVSIPPEPPHTAAAPPPPVAEVVLDSASPRPVPAPTRITRRLPGGTLGLEVAEQSRAPAALPRQALAVSRKAPRRWTRWIAGLAVATLSLALVAWFLEPLRSRLAPYFERPTVEGPGSRPVTEAPSGPAPGASQPATPPASVPSPSPPAAAGAAVRPTSEASAGSAGPTPAVSQTQRRDQSGKRASLAPPAGKPKPAAPKRPADQTTLHALTAEGDAFFRRGEYDRAIESFSKALRLDPASESLHTRILRARSAKAAEEKYLNE